MDTFNPTSNQGKHSISELMTYLADLKFMRFFPKGKTFLFSESVVFILESSNGEQISKEMSDNLEKDLLGLVGSGKLDLAFTPSRQERFPVSALIVYLCELKNEDVLTDESLAALKSIEKDIEIFCVKRGFTPRSHPEAKSRAFDPDRWR